MDRRASLLSLLMVLSAHAGSPPALEPALESLFARLPDKAAVAGACVLDLGNGKVLFAHHADQPLVPASTMKLFVMAAALNELGPGFSFDTVLATNGSDCIVIGDGDPGFGDEKLHKERGERITTDFDRWAAALLARGMSQFSGGIVIDDSIFDEQRVHPSWEADDLDNWYAAPVGALNFNDNCVDITVTPDRKFDAPPSISVQPENSVVKIVNACKSGGKRMGPDRRWVSEPILNHAPFSMEYVISSRCAKSWTFSPVSFPDPGLLFADSFRTGLARGGIQPGGEIRRLRLRLDDGSLPPTLSVVDRRRTPIAEVLSRIGKDSQNLFAECLLKRAGYAWAKRHGQPDPRGSWATGAAAVNELIRSAHIESAGLQVSDGSGLSRDNRCTARQLASLLAWMHRRPEAELFRESLSIAGEDGSLRKRLKDMRGSVYCKTGTMRGIRSLAGYVYAENGRVYAFATIFNGYKGSSAPYKEIQDRLCRILAGVKPPGTKSQ